MLILRWVLLLFLSAATDLVGVAPVAPVEAVEEGEEVLHGNRLRRLASVRASHPQATREQRPQPGLAPARARWTAGPPDPASARPTVRKIPSSGPEPGSSADDH